MAKKQETGLDRLKKLALWQWGLIVIFSGLLSNVVMGMQASNASSSAARRGAEMGRGVATLFFIVVGVILIVLHFVKRKSK